MKSRIRIVVATKVIERLQELGQMDLVDSAIGSLKKHLALLPDGNLEKHF